MTSLYRLTDEDLGAEDRFRSKCGDAIGVNAVEERFIDYRFLAELIADPTLPSTHLMKIGWTHAQIAALPTQSETANDIDERWKSAAGRLVAMPAFLTARDDLRTAWLAIPAGMRPTLPLRLARNMPLPADAVVAPRELADFAHRFKQFCEQWAIFEMATWNHPLPYGPQWPRIGTPLVEPGFSHEARMATPVHFPVTAKDGLGDLVRDEQNRAVALHGVTDIGRWKTYSQFLEIDHLDRVFRSRYPKLHRQGFVGRLDQLIADRLALDVDRLRKLRKQLRALQSGRLHSLAESR